LIEHGPIALAELLHILTLSHTMCAREKRASFVRRSPAQREQVVARETWDRGEGEK
jgi:hypothetical protein